MTIVAGAVAGILGITGWLGFAFYLSSQMTVRWGKGGGVSRRMRSRS